MNKDIHSLGAVQLAEVIRNGTISSVEVVTAFLARIKAFNPKYHAITRIMANTALESADRADQIQSRQGPSGPLHGVPFTIKENIEVHGTATSLGLAELKDRVAQTDAPVVINLKQAGAIPLARTNLPELALRYHTANPVYGTTLNPWRDDLTAGGSRGGEAVALATGMTPLGVASDYGGSLRWPSQCNGVAALRPTPGRIADATASNTSELPISMQLCRTIGPMARRIEDLRLAFEVMSQRSVRDPWWTPGNCDTCPMDQSIPIAITYDPMDIGVEPSIVAGLNKTAEILRSKGYSVTEISPDLIGETASLYGKVASSEIHFQLLPQAGPYLSKEARRFIQYYLDTQPEPDLMAYINALAERRRLAREWGELLEKYPVLLTPVSTMNPFKIGFDIAGVREVQQLVSAMGLVMSISLVGMPSVVLPVGMDQGLPQSVQIISGRFQESLCLDVAEIIENEAGFILQLT